MAHPLDLRVVRTLDSFKKDNETYFLDYCKSEDFTISKGEVILKGQFYKTEAMAILQFNKMKPGYSGMTRSRPSSTKMERTHFTMRRNIKLIRTT